GNVVHHRLGQGDIAHVVDPAHPPRRNAESSVRAPIKGGDMADRTWTKMLIALGRAIPRAVWNADESDIAGGRIFVPGTTEEGGNAPPVPPLHAFLCLLEFLVIHRL